MTGIAVKDGKHFAAQSHKDSRSEYRPKAQTKHVPPKESDSPRFLRFRPPELSISLAPPLTNESVSTAGF
jgi:hypothetical protein